MPGTARPDIINVDVRTLRREDASTSQADKITLAGITYTIDKVLSDTTGEGEIFKLSNGGNVYVLKLYYPGYAPDMEVEKVLKESAGTGVLVDIIEYGTTEYRGESRFFELMPFYGGGEPKPGTMRGNPDKLKATALGMIMAIKTAHDHKLLHKDIKPNNFLYTDGSHTGMVLADFGLAQPFAYKDGKFEIVSYSQARTSIYAAPELYANTLQLASGQVEVRFFDEKSDYFSLGVSLLTLWIGEQPLQAIGEYDLNRLKRRETGTLPIPDDMPSDIARLINGLTTPNPMKRWAFDEFTRWLKGEEVAIDGYEKEATTGLHIVYIGSKGQTAESLEDLATFMLDDRKLAANYLTSGKISKWLEEAGYPELVAQIDEIVKKTYASNPQAAVTAVTYLLDPTLPYISPRGKALRTQQEIAADIVADNSAYGDEIQQRDSALYIYFNALGAPHFADKFVPEAKKNIVFAIWRLVFTLDPSQSFPVLDPATHRYTEVNTVAELLDTFAVLPPYAWDNDKTGYGALLTDEAFIQWLAHRDPALAGKIKSKLMPYEKMEKKPRQLYYYALYLLDPSRPFELENSVETKHQTAEELTRKVNLDYLCYYVAGRVETPNPDFLILPEQLMDCRDNRLYFYLKSKEVYQEKIDYIHYAFDFNIKEHKNSTGPYDKDVAFFKAAKALAGEAQYAFVIDGTPKVIYNLDDLKEIPLEAQKEELRNGKMKAWLAVQYHEDPFADLSQQYAYEELLSDYTWHLNDIDDEEKVVERYTDASMEIIGREERIKKLLWSNYICRALFCLFIVLPLLGLGTYVAINGCATFAKPSPFWHYLLIGFIPLTVGLRVIQIFPKVDKWLLQPFGEKFYNTLLLHRWIVSAIYAFAVCLLCWSLETFGGGIAGHIIIPVICLAVVIWRYVLAIKEYPLVQSAYQDVIHPDMEAMKYEPLYWAWRGYKDGDFDSETLDRQNIYIEGIKAARHFCITRTLFSLIPVALLIGLYIPFSKPFENYIKQNDPVRWEKVYGEGSVKEEVKIETTRYYADVKKSLSVRKSASKSASKLGSLSAKEEIDVVSIEDGWAKIVYGDDFGYVDAYYIKPIDKESKAATAKKSAVKEKSATSETPAAEVKTPEPAAPKLYTLRPNYNQIDVYSAKNTQSQFMIGTLPAGETFEILSSDGQWTKINYNGRDAYVRTMMIVPVEN